MERNLYYFILKNTVRELENSSKNILANKLLEIINNCEIPKPERQFLPSGLN